MYLDNTNYTKGAVVRRSQGSVYCTCHLCVRHAPEISHWERYAPDHVLLNSTGEFRSVIHAEFHRNVSKCYTETRCIARVGVYFTRRPTHILHTQHSLHSFRCAMSPPLICCLFPMWSILQCQYMNSAVYCDCLEANVSLRTRMLAHLRKRYFVRTTYIGVPRGQLKVTTSTANWW